jgi:hypothetical protein
MKRKKLFINFSLGLNYSYSNFTLSMFLITLLTIYSNQFSFIVKCNNEISERLNNLREHIDYKKNHKFSHLHLTNKSHKLMKNEAKMKNNTFVEKENTKYSNNLNEMQITETNYTKVIDEVMEQDLLPTMNKKHKHHNPHLLNGDYLKHRTPLICVPSYISNSTSFYTEEDHESDLIALISTSVVHWLLSGGASVIPIHYWRKGRNLEILLDQCNAVLLGDAGNIYDMIENENPLNFNFLKFIYQKIKSKGDVPIYAVGSSIQLIQIFEANRTDIIFEYNNSHRGQLLANEILINDIKKVRIVKYFDGRDLLNFQSKNSTPNYSNTGVSPDAYNKIENLKKMFKIISLAKYYVENEFENNNIKFIKKNEEFKFISIIEAYRYPIYAISFDPAKYIFNKYDQEILLNYSNEAFTISQKILNFFVNEAYMNLYHKVENGFYNHPDNLKFFKKLFRGVNIIDNPIRKISGKSEDLEEGYYFAFKHKLSKNEKLASILGSKSNHVFNTTESNKHSSNVQENANKKKESKNSLHNKNGHNKKLKNEKNQNHTIIHKDNNKLQDHNHNITDLHTNHTHSNHTNSDTKKKKNKIKKKKNEAHRENNLYLVNQIKDEKSELEFIRINNKYEFY